MTGWFIESYTLGSTWYARRMEYSLSPSFALSPVLTYHEFVSATPASRTFTSIIWAHWLEKPRRGSSGMGRRRFTRRWADGEPGSKGVIACTPMARLDL